MHNRDKVKKLQMKREWDATAQWDTAATSSPK